MAKAILTAKVSPSYDDLLEERYHFPRTYLRQVEAAIGDWIIYYEPRRLTPDANSLGGRKAYFAVAFISDIVSDERRSDHFYARIGEYLDFYRPVPFREGNSYFETGLKKSDGSTNKGAFRRSVRNIPDREFDLILAAGFGPLVSDQASLAESANSDGFEDPPSTFERPIVDSLLARPFRDRAFMTSVRSAYSETCALTGLKIINGGGRPEVQAAHIRPVAYSGPDSVRNGIALCGTVHWMFDRGLISLDDDYTILTAPDSTPNEIRELLNQTGKMTLPPRPELYPHPKFLRYHRQNIFKG